MQITDIPAKTPTPFALNAAAGNVTSPIPLTPQSGGHASFQEGFPAVNFIPVASGGIPPWGNDVNGAHFVATSWARWFQAGAPVNYDGTFQTAIGGYPAGAVVQSATVLGSFWLCLVDNNGTNPDTGGAGWRSLITSSTPAHGECYLQRNTSTVLALLPKNGNNVRCGGSQYHLPVSGITSANTGVTINGTPAQNLAAGNTYYVTFNGVEGHLNFWSSGHVHAPDTTAGNGGIEVIWVSGSPQTNETLVGLIAMDTNAHFQVQGQGTVSWFNQAPITLTGNTFNNQSTTSTIYVELNSGAEVNVVTWATNTVTGRAWTNASNNTSGKESFYAVGLDGGAVGTSEIAITAPANNAAFSGVSITEGMISEGQHTISAFGKTGSGSTSTFNVTVLATVWG